MRKLLLCLALFCFSIGFLCADDSVFSAGLSIGYGTVENTMKARLISSGSVFQTEVRKTQGLVISAFSEHRIKDSFAGELELDYMFSSLLLSSNTWQKYSRDKASLDSFAIKVGVKYKTAIGNRNSLNLRFGVGYEFTNSYFLPDKDGYKFSSFGLYCGVSDEYSISKSFSLIAGADVRFGLFGGLRIWSQDNWVKFEVFGTTYQITTFGLMGKLGAVYRFQ